MSTLTVFKSAELISEAKLREAKDIYIGIDKRRLNLRGQEVGIVENSIILTAKLSPSEVVGYSHFVGQHYETPKEIEAMVDTIAKQVKLFEEEIKKAGLSVKPGIWVA